MIVKFANYWFNIQCVENYRYDFNGLPLINLNTYNLSLK